MTAEPLAAVHADQDDIDRESFCNQCGSRFQLDEVMVGVPADDGATMATCVGCAPPGPRIIHRYARP